MLRLFLSLMRTFGTWLKTQFHALYAVPSYLRALAKEWVSILFGETILGAAFLIWLSLTNPSNGKLLFAFVAAMFMAGFYAWYAAYARLERRIEIIQISPREWPVQRGEPHAYQRAKAYQIEIINRSKGVTVENVSVQLSAIDPKWANWEFLPIPLHLRHDNPSRPEDQMRAFSLDPEEQRNIDFISAFEGDNRFSVVHVVHGATWEVPYTDRNRLQVRITARDMPAVFVWFKVWRDKAGVLQCELEKREDRDH